MSCPTCYGVLSKRARRLRTNLVIPRVHRERNEGNEGGLQSTTKILQLSCLSLSIHQQIRQEGESQGPGDRCETCQEAVNALRVS